MGRLYEKVLAIENIKAAIKEILSNDGSKTAGKDGINKYNLPNTEEIVKEVKLRLRRYKKVNCKYLEIPKENGERRRLCIINLYDRIAQQCVYRQIVGIVEIRSSNHSYGFRKGINAKTPVAKICNGILKRNEHYTVELDLSKCFDNILLSKCIGSLIEDFKIKDLNLLKTIKHLMYVDRKYNGLGISQGTVLGPLLCNVYLNKLDRYMENNFELEKKESSYKVNDRRHSKEWIAWNKRTGRKIYCKYYRYADDTIVICRRKVEQEYIYSCMKWFIENEMALKINEEKTKLGDNDSIDFLGFNIKRTLEKNKRYIGIKISKPKKIEQEIKKFKLLDHKELLKFLKFVVGVLNYFNICNDLSRLLGKIATRLYFRSAERQSKKSIIKRIKGKSNDYYEEYKRKDKRTRIIFDVWELRRNSKLSYKEYLVNDFWLKIRSYLNCTEYDSRTILRYLKYTEQKGLDYCDGSRLDINSMKLHHKKSIRFGGDNSLSNLVLVSEENHKLIHKGEMTKNKKLNRLIKMLK